MREVGGRRNNFCLSSVIAAALPAEVKKYRFDEETIKKLLERQWWNGSAEELKKVGEMEFRVGDYLS